MHADQNDRERDTVKKRERETGNWHNSLVANACLGKWYFIGWQMLGNKYARKYTQ